jgi:hypothetical protein
MGDSLRDGTHDPTARHGFTMPDNVCWLAVVDDLAVPRLTQHHAQLRRL